MTLLEPRAASPIYLERGSTAEVRPLIKCLADQTTS